MDTPITFGTDGWRATLDVFTTPRLQMVGQAVAEYLQDVPERAEDGIAIGYDARADSRQFAEELARVLAANGLDVYIPTRDCPTPVVAWNIVHRGLAGALMVTASHNPPEYNGVKFIPHDGAPALPSVTDEIEARLAEPNIADPEEFGTVHELDFLSPYAEHVFSLVDTEGFEDLTVVYDAMHGSGRDVTDRLLEEAGATVERLRCDRDPQFGGSAPEPDAEHLEGLVAAVEERDADLGIANDGDSDRIAIVTPGRGFLDENLFFAAIYDYLLETDSGPAVRTVSTTFLVDRIADAHGEDVIETAVGFKWVAEAMGEHDALVGGEESGGFSIRGHIREKDGVLMGLLAAAAAVEKPFDERVDDLLAEHGDVVQDKVSLACPDAEKERVIEQLEEVIPDEVLDTPVERIVTLDGFKILLADGSWLLVRPSGTEPAMRVYGEAESRDRVADLLVAGRELVEPLI